MALINEMLSDGRIRRYSDLDMFIEQTNINTNIKTPILFEEAVDVLPCMYLYEETNIKIPKQDILTTNIE